MYCFTTFFFFLTLFGLIPVFAAQQKQSQPSSHLYFKSKQGTLFPLPTHKTIQSPVLNSFCWAIIQKNAKSSHLAHWQDFDRKSPTWELSDVDNAILAKFVELLNLAPYSEKQIVFCLDIEWQTLFEIHKLADYFCISSLEHFLLQIYLAKALTDDYIIKQPTWPFSKDLDNEIINYYTKILQKKDISTLLRWGRLSKKAKIDLTNNDLAHNCTFITFSQDAKKLLCAHSHGRIETYCLELNTFKPNNFYKTNALNENAFVTTNNNGSIMCILENVGLIRYFNKGTDSGYLASTEKISHANISSDGSCIVHISSNLVTFQKLPWAFPITLSLPMIFFSDSNVVCMAPNHNGDSACIIFNETTIDPQYDPVTERHLVIANALTQKTDKYFLSVESEIQVTSCFYGSNFIIIAYWNERKETAYFDIISLETTPLQRWSIQSSEPISEKIISISFDDNSQTFAFLHPRSISLWTSAFDSPQLALLMLLKTEKDALENYIPSNGWARETLEKISQESDGRKVRMIRDNSYCTIV